MSTNQPSQSLQADEIAALIAEVIPPQNLGFMLGMLRDCAHTDPAQVMAEVEKKYRFIPVSIQHFVESPQYLNAGGTIYPKVMEELEEINSGQYVEVVLTGGIGSAKTTTALYTTAYQLYLLACMRNPHQWFGLDPASEILVIFQNINKHLAMGVDYQRFRTMLKESPWFKENFPFDVSKESKLVFPNRIEVLPVAGTETAAIGQNVIGGVIDELNYMAVIEHSKMNVDGATYDQAVQLYNSIARRRKSRFMTKGKLPGILCLVSSKRYPGEFTDRKIEEATKDPTIYVYDKRVWDVKPDGTYSGEVFHVFIGDEHRKPRILREEEYVDPGDRELVDAIPVEFKGEFETDIINALREIAGHSTLAKHPYFTNVEAVAACMGKVPSVFSRDQADFVETQLKVLPTRFFRPDLPRFAHIDLAISSDSVGMVIGCCTGFTQVRRGTVELENEIIETLPKIRIDGVLEVSPPKGGEILFFKVRQVLYVLKKLGLNIKWVTFDSFQSTDSMQLLRQQGFMTGYCSMDVSTGPYDVTKTALYDGRVEMPYHEKLMKELASLEKVPKTGKIDHPPRGSKDCADALAGVVYGLTMRREVWHMFGVPIMQMPESVRVAVQREQGQKSNVDNSGSHNG